MRRAARTDENQAEIVAAIRALGASWLDLSAVGGGCGDGLVGFQGRNIFLEIKRPLGPKGGEKGRTLTPDQVVFHANWRGQITVVRTIDEAIKAVMERR